MSTGIDGWLLRSLRLAAVTTFVAAAGLPRTDGTSREANTRTRGGTALR